MLRDPAAVQDLDIGYVLWIQEGKKKQVAAMLSTPGPVLSSEFG